MIEWMIGIILFTALMIFITSGFCMMCMFMLYDVSPWYIFSTYLFFWPPLFFSCICTGFACLQIIVLLGKRGMELGFAVGWFLMPFSGAYYPIEVLPAWGQMISAVLPMSYIFQGMRTYVMYKGDPTLYLIKGYILSMVYAIVAALLFMCCFKRSKQKGLARLAD
jgi:ABC-2 type transport system permease protein